MIDTKELRRLAQAATPGPWVSQGRYIGTPRHMSYIGEVRDQCGNWSDTEKSRADSAFIAAANPAAVIELLDRLEESESDCLEQASLNGMGASREAALMAKLEAAEKERDTLRAELDALKSREGEVVYRWLALDYSGFCYGSNPPDNLPNRCNLKAFYALAEVAP